MHVDGIARLALIALALGFFCPLNVRSVPLTNFVWNAGESFLRSIRQPLRSSPIDWASVPGHSTDTSPKSLLEISRDGSQRTLLPPILFLLLGASRCEASPLNPQLASLSCPFFQGWLVRSVDHSKQLSIILIIGSFSASGSQKYVEHYVFCGVDAGPDGRYHVEAFPSPETVTIEGSPPTSSSLRTYFSPEGNTFPLNITWTAAGVGKFIFREAACTADFSLEGLKVRLNATQRTPWAKNNIQTSGPEGWLGYTSLLPCHYFVHSVGSPCEYVLSLPKAPNTLWRKEVRGCGIAHIEGNHGAFFPQGWVWSQAVSADNRASMSLIAGMFDIGTFSPLNVVLYLRTPKRTLIFRTTDFASVALGRLDFQAGVVSLTASHIGNPVRVRVDIQSGGPQSFGPSVYIPTATGFSNSPGCRETYTAVATVTCSEFDSQLKRYVITETLVFPLTALEFGASFLTKNIFMSKASPGLSFLRPGFLGK